MRQSVQLKPSLLHSLLLSICFSVAIGGFLSSRNACIRFRRSILDYQVSNNFAFRKDMEQRSILERPHHYPLLGPAVTGTQLHHQHVIKTLASTNKNSWDGDDLRWSSKALRRIRRQQFEVKRKTARNVLLGLNIFIFLYQVMTTVYAVRTRHPNYWPSKAVFIVLDCVWGSVQPGPFTMDFVHNQHLSVAQPHRFITSGFMHSGIVHLLANMHALLNLPSWLESGLGPSLYLTTYLAAIIGGNIADIFINLDSATCLCLGASGGICGLYGLMYVSLIRMENKLAAYRVLKGMGVLFLYGVLFSNISNAGHVGGFFTGMIVGIVSGPSYVRSYAMRRKNSLESDLFSRDYRQAMGYDKKPTARGYVPIQILWMVSFAAILLSRQRKYWTVPNLILRGVLHPGSLTKELL